MEKEKRLIIHDEPDAVMPDSTPADTAERGEHHHHSSHHHHHSDGHHHSSHHHHHSDGHHHSSHHHSDGHHHHSSHRHHSEEEKNTKKGFGAWLRQNLFEILLFAIVLVACVFLAVNILSNGNKNAVGGDDGTGMPSTDISDTINEGTADSSDDVSMVNPNGSNISVSASAQVSVILPKDLYIANGVQVDINYQSIVRGMDVDKMTVMPFVRNNAYPTYEKHTVLVGGEAKDQTITLMMQPSATRSLNATLNVHNVPADAGKGETKKVLFIGDSKTEAGVYTQCLLDMFAEDGMNIELMGTQGSGKNRHEGRSGWSAKDYCSPEPGRNAEAGISPFYNDAVKTFDLAYYMSNQGYSDVDYVFINLGTNDNVNEFVGYYQDMIKSIKAYDADIAIGLWVPAPFATFGGYTYQTNDTYTFDKMSALITSFDTEAYQAQKVYVMPTHMTINTEYDFRWKEVPYNVNKPEQTYRVCTDQIHETYGYYKVANVIFGYIKHFATLTDSE